MTSDPLIQFKNIKESCLKHFPEKELWPTYFERRYLEFLTFYELLPKKQYLKVLELGCGMGYYSAFLSFIAESVVATDLEETDPNTHSIGLQATRDFLTSLDIKNVTVVHASAEDLPFNDNSFDLVFSSHVLEHVPQGEKAVQEINRVLMPGGINFCVVPTTTDRLYALPSFYFYLLKRSFVKLFSLKNNTSNASPKSSNPTVNLKESVNLYAKHLPFPPPHGIYPSFTDELKNWTLSSWVKLLTSTPNVNLLRQHGLQMNPIFALISGLFPHAGLKLYSLTRRTENKLSRNRFLKFFGISTLIITEKR